MNEYLNVAVVVVVVVAVSYRALERRRSVKRSIREAGEALGLALRKPESFRLTRRTGPSLYGELSGFIIEVYAELIEKRHEKTSFRFRASASGDDIADVALTRQGFWGAIFNKDHQLGIKETDEALLIGGNLHEVLAVLDVDMRRKLTGEDSPFVREGETFRIESRRVEYCVQSSVASAHLAIRAVEQAVALARQLQLQPGDVPVKLADHVLNDPDLEFRFRCLMALIYEDSEGEVLAGIVPQLPESTNHLNFQALSDVLNERARGLQSLGQQAAELHPFVAARVVTSPALDPTGGGVATVLSLLEHTDVSVVQAGARVMAEVGTIADVEHLDNLRRASNGQRKRALRDAMEAIQGRSSGEAGQVSLAKPRPSQGAVSVAESSSGALSEMDAS